MVDVARCFGEHHGLARLGAVLHADARKQIRELEILLLGPLFERMVVAAGARDALAEKRLGHVFRQIDGIFMQHEVIERPVLTGAAGTGKNLAGELVPGLVGLHPVADPIVESPHRGRTQLTAGNQQQVGPFVGPIIDEFVLLQEAVDQLGALVFGTVAQEGFHVLGGGQRARSIQVRAADKGRVVRDFRWRDVQLLQLVDHQIVDVVPAREFDIGVGRHLVGIRNRQTRIQHPARKPERHGGLARPVHLHVAPVVHARHPFVVRRKLHPARYVVHAAIGIASPDYQLLLVAGLERGHRWEHFQRGHIGIVGGERGSAGGDPLSDHAVLQRIHREPFAAAMGNRKRGLQQHQAGRGLGQGHAPTHRTAGKRVIVHFRIVAAQGQLEPVLSGQRAVARSLIAAGLGHHRDHVILEAPREWRLRILHSYVYACSALAGLRGDDGLAIGHRAHQPLGVHCGDGWI